MIKTIDGARELKSISVDKSVNLSAIASSIISEVRYFVTKSTGTEVRAVNVFVDSISVD